MRDIVDPLVLHVYNQFNDICEALNLAFPKKVFLHSYSRKSNIFQIEEYDYDFIGAELRNTIKVHDITVEAMMSLSVAELVEKISNALIIESVIN